LLNQCGINDIIRINAQHILTMGMIQTGVPCTRKSLIPLMNHAYTIIDCGPLITQGGTVIRRPIIDQNNLEIPIGLANNGSQAIITILVNVVDGNDYGHQRLNV